jgi:hypothetical protein
MWMKETQGLRATKGFRKTLEKTTETYKSRGFILLFPRKTERMFFQHFSLSGMKEVYLPAFRDIDAQQYIFSLYRPICKLFNDAVLAVTITIIF